MPRSRVNPQRARRAVRKAENLRQENAELKERIHVLESLAVSIIPKIPEEAAVAAFNERQLPLIEEKPMNQPAGSTT